MSPMLTAIIESAVCQRGCGSDYHPAEGIATSNAVGDGRDEWVTASALFLMIEGNQKVNP